jgi:two-component system sensor histidine kinase MtrB
VATPARERGTPAGRTTAGRSVPAARTLRGDATAAARAVRNRAPFLLRAGLAWLGTLLAAAARLARTRWRRSLSLRVVLTTFVLSAIVVSLLGFVVVGRITSGLLDAEQTQAHNELRFGVSKAEQQLAASDSGDHGARQLTAENLISDLGSRGGSSGSYGVVLVATSASGSGLVDGDISSASVPPALSQAVSHSGREAYAYTTLNYLDGTTGPGLVYGAPVRYLDQTPYQLYYLFPLGQQVHTVSFVRGAVGLAGLGLVVLLAAIAALVTRQVVTPVRLARRTAERLAAGRLWERMAVRGEDDLARLATSFNDMAANLQGQIRQLEELSRVQRRFVADVSHELRTPLTTVRMAADVLYEARPAFREEVARSAELLQTQLDRFEALLTDLLEISRHDAGAVALDVEPVDLRDVVRRVVAQAEPLAARAGTELRLDLPATAAVAESDARRVERILRNLVSNAIKHGGGGPVDVRLRADGAAVAVVVRDYGAGFAVEDAARVFNRFWRADPARARSAGGGTGLGLSIALEDARLHGGWLQAWGEPGRGAAFRLTLPGRIGQHVARSPLPLADPAPVRVAVPPDPAEPAESPA